MLKASARKTRWHALGAMSGTSLDGVDAAMLETDGEQIFGFGKSAYRAYSSQEREVLTRALGQWSGDLADAAQDIVNKAHSEVLGDFSGAEIVGFHGQTLAHEPRGRGTFQVGDGQALARDLDRPVV